MNQLTRYRKLIALWLFFVMLCQMLMPLQGYALTSGPSQPEMQGFEPVSNSDMVDLFSGDFTYNVPLMDVGGYPVNMAYHSGTNMDDEASWVGNGWSLNVGSLNRQLRGLPDDFNGSEKMTREMNMRDHTTKGGRFSVTLDLLGIPVLKFLKKIKKKKLNFSLTLSAGVKVDNYRGIGMELGANAGVSLTNYVAGDKTSTDRDSANNVKLGLNLGLNLSSMDGASVSMNASVQRNFLGRNDKLYGLGNSIGFGYNSRAGSQGLTLGSSFSSQKFQSENSKSARRWASNIFSNSSSSFISFNGETFSPTIEHPTANNTYTLSVQVGGELWVVLVAGGVTGFYSTQHISEKLRSLPAYGYLYSEKGKDDDNALFDINREKDIPYSSEVKYLPIPIPAYDLFTANSQDGGGQYRAYRGSSGVYFDHKSENSNVDLSLGLEAGAGLWFDIGGDFYAQVMKTKTKSWRDQNDFLSKGAFQTAGTDPYYENTYFKRVGEPVPYNPGYLAKLKGTSPVSVVLRKTGTPKDGAYATNKLATKTSRVGETASLLKKDQRDVRNTTFSYLTAKEASNYALDKMILDYNPDSIGVSGCSGGAIQHSYNRVSDYRKQNHFSEVTITGDDGKRSVYGIPVYNTTQEEVSFSVPENLSMRNRGIIKYNNGSDNSASNSNGREAYYSKEKTPAYATSYLLTSILSPDYVDRTGNGITDDDLGTAVKFNYSKLSSSYKWRTPFANGIDSANYNEGFLSDARDDKASYVYGEKEIWYLHSIESKTMVAKFITEDRRDALGVLNSEGGVDTTHKLKLLKEIRLYSKSDLLLNPGHPENVTPIKVVHFQYDYSVCRGLPNSMGHEGKLTLKKVWFSFGQNNKGRLNPYEFGYDTAYNSYGYRQYDRWGNFKNAADNPGGLNNSEFPYTLQDKAKTDSFVSAGQLNMITLPSGGSIHVTYESDDYGYVQDRRASQMCFVNGISSVGSSTGLINSDYIYVNLPVPVSASELKERYFQDIKRLYFKFFLDLDHQGHSEFVPGYADLESFTAAEYDGTGKVKTVRLKLSKLEGYNPITYAGWQFARTNLPKWAYPGSENIDVNNSSTKKVIEALVAAFGSIKELIGGFTKRAKTKLYSDKVNLSKSWVRLCAPEWKKLGGGSRVKQIRISDDWAAMSGASGAQTAIITQDYNYTVKDAKGRSISSGVASYEPTLGNDENPFRQPVNYKVKQFLALDNYYYIEEPFCESLFPGAGVGYSSVTIRSIGAGDEGTVNRTGSVVSEFFTARDYPVAVDIMPEQEEYTHNDKLLQLISIGYATARGLSQGYSIELNDMHGKPKSTKVYNKSGVNISSIEYFYKSTSELAEKKTLSNDVNVVKADGSIEAGSIGMDVEFAADMRQQTTDNIGGSIKVSGGSGAILWFPLPFFFPGLGFNYETRSYRSASTIKIINRFAIQYKVRKMENGSTIETENLLWDAETGNVLLTKTQNEYDDPVFSFAYPAHWAYGQMGQSYNNLGSVFSSFSTDINATVINSIYRSMLVPGDELIDLNTEHKYWITGSPTDFDLRRLIDKDGNLARVTNVILKLLRSGRRNMANTSIGFVTMLSSPVRNGFLDISSVVKILDAKATTFTDEWEMPFGNCSTCSPGYTLSEDGTYCYTETTPQIDTANCYTICSGDILVPEYSGLGTIIHHPGYNSAGGGGVDTVIHANGFWKGGTSCPEHPVGRGDDLPTTPTPDSSALSSAKKSLNSSKQALHDLDETVGECTQTPEPRVEGYCGPLSRTTVWTCAGYQDGYVRLPVNTWIGFSRCISFPTTKTYYFGIGADNFYRLWIDGEIVLDLSLNDNNFYYWNIFPVTLIAGSHQIQVEAKNEGGPAAFGAEIYNNSYSEIVAAASYDDLDLLFSTKDVIGEEFNVGKYSCPIGYSLSTCGTSPSCSRRIPTGQKVVNPYNYGILGNWRPKSQYVYQVKREVVQPDNSNPASTNTRTAGAYVEFNPFWHQDGGAGWVPNNPDPMIGDQRWIAASEVTYVNSKGLEIENKDALNRYSTASFGYLESLPSSVASNSRYREIAFDGFEDYGFRLDCQGQDTCTVDHFSFRDKIDGSNIDTTSLYAHSGRYSLKLSGSVTIEKSVYSGSSDAFYSVSDGGQFVLQSAELAKGFSPLPGKKYLLSFWAKDGDARNASTSVQATVNGTDLISNLSRWPVVEGWKRIEVPFEVPAPATNFSLTLQPASGDTYFDDIRIHPYDGQMKSFVYDPSSLRLMAEMDENNFATFYEYDDEGILIRVKKETERGIMTIKETRSAYRKRQ